MAIDSTLRGIRLRINQATDASEKPEVVFALTDATDQSWTLARIVAGEEGSFGGRLAVEVNAGGGAPADETTERLVIDSAGDVGIGGNLTVAGALQAGAIVDVASEITALKGHTHSAADVGALPIGGGTVAGDLTVEGTLQAGAISDVAAEITTLKGHTHTAADVGALPITGGTVSGKLDVTGAINAGEIRMNGAPLNLSQWSTVSRGICYSAGRVGIGTTTPEALLDVFTSSASGAHLMLGGHKITLRGVNDPASYQPRLPFIEWRQGDNKRAMYLGWGDTQKKFVSMKLENGYTLSISGGIVEIEQDSWKTIRSFANGWRNYSNTYNPAGYFKDSMGIVHLRGLVRLGTIRKHIFTLPAGYRPARRELQVACTYPNHSGRVDILANGQVLPYAGDKRWISLDGITFRAAR
jgi:hypothetical protein